MNRIVKNTLKIILVICVFALVGAFVILLMENDNIQQVDFNAEKWATGDYYVRGSMRDALVKKYSFKGKNIDLIEKILGKPDETGNCKYTYHTAMFVNECMDVTGNVAYIEWEFDCITKIITGCRYYTD